MQSRPLKSYSKHRGFRITYNPKERTYSIYSENNEFLSTVDDGELNAELDRLENDYYGTD